LVVAAITAAAINLSVASGAAKVTTGQWPAGWLLRRPCPSFGAVFVEGRNDDGTTMSGSCRRQSSSGKTLLPVPDRFTEIDFLGVCSGTRNRPGAATDDCARHDTDRTANETIGRSCRGASRGATLHAARFGCSAAGKQGNGSGKDEFCHEVRGQSLCCNARYCRTPKSLALLTSTFSTV
jgi:hypothetical protein